MYVLRTRFTSKGRSRLLGGAAVVALVLSAAACGGGGGKTTTSTAAGGTSAAQWATGVCSSVTTWKKSLQSIQTNVASQPSKTALQNAGKQIETATETLAHSLKQLGKPDTAQGEAAKKNLDTLATTLQLGMTQIKNALNKPSSGGTMAQIATISTTLSAMANNLKMAGSSLKNFAPSNELKQAFEQSSACKPYIHSSS
jgi:hypothetical protein